MTVLVQTAAGFILALALIATTASCDGVDDVLLPRLNIPDPAMLLILSHSQDSDGDGTPDITDAYPDDPERDGHDTDSDGDGVPDMFDSYPLDPELS